MPTYRYTSKTAKLLTLTLFILIISSLVLVGCTTAEPEPTTEPPEPTSTATAQSEPTSTPTLVPTEEPEIIGLAPDGEPRSSYFAPFPLTITLDGDLSDWADVPLVTIPEGAADLDGATYVTFAAAADENFLYLLGNVNDTNIISGQHGANYWNEDSVEFYVNGTNDLALTSYRDGVAQFTVPPLNIGKAPEEFIFAGVNNETVPADLAIVATDSGYLIELALPLKSDVWNIPLQHGAVVGFQLHLNSAATADRNAKIIWSAADTSDSSYYDPSVFGEIIFFEIGRDEVTRVEPEITPIPTGIPVEADALYKQSDASMEDRIEDLLARMTLAEKVGQMTLIEKGSMKVDDIGIYGIGGLLSGGGGVPDENTPEGWAAMVDNFQSYAIDSRLGIPLIYGVDAVHGHNNVYGATIFPHNIGLGAANNPALMEQIGQATALEMAATGIYWNYAPGMMVPQDIRWGRTYEGYSENTDIVTDLSVAYLRGLQGSDLMARDTVVATPKHFIGDGATVWGSSTTGGYRIDQGVTEVSEEVLRAVHLPPYIAAIEEGARTIMISYSSWGGIKMHGQQYLINDVLKGELGFDGFIVSDWGGIDQITPDYYESVAAAINAGIDMNMVPYSYGRFISTTIKAVEEGDIPMERIDDAVRRILKIKFEMGLFENPYSDPSYIPFVGADEHRQIARQAVAESLVLLKNDGGILPLDKDITRLFVGGNAADDIGIQSGGWTIEWQGKKGDITEGTTILEAIQGAVSADTEVIYELSGRFSDVVPTADDVCLAVVGEDPYSEGVGDSATLLLPRGASRVLRQMESLCENLVVILVSGRPVMVTDFVENWNGLVAAWLPGTEGQGVADVLFGDVPFTGQLPYTWPAVVEQIEDPSLGEPLFPFGFGLSE